jgi:cell volume regulation protein A
MSEVGTAFFITALVIIIGYFGLIFFKKTKISEIIILLLVGLIIGPVSTYLGYGFLDDVALANFEGFLPFFASFALIMILFEGGMQLNFFKTIKALPGTLTFTLAVFILSLILSVAVLWFLGLANLLVFDPLLALFIAAIVGGTSSAVIIPIVKNTSAKEETKTLLSLESALTDSLCVITAVAIAEIFLIGSGNVSLSTISSGIFANFSIATLFGFIFGLFWLKVMTYLQGKSYEYLMTLAALLLLYSTVEFIGGNGAIAALLFGMVLGNSEDITGMLRLTRRSVDTRIKNFQSEISFLIKTFFFVYLGLLFRFEYVSAQVIIVSLAILVLVLFSRKMVGKIISKFRPIFTKDQKLITWMSARGLAAAVLVSLPVSMGLDKIPNTLFTPELLNQITAIAFFVILLTNIATTAGIFMYENENPTEKAPIKREQLLKDLKETAKKTKEQVK